MTERLRMDDCLTSTQRDEGGSAMKEEERFWEGNVLAAARPTLAVELFDQESS
jgi:hypothetical protein